MRSGKDKGTARDGEGEEVSGSLDRRSRNATPCSLEQANASAAAAAQEKAATWDSERPRLLETLAAESSRLEQGQRARFQDRQEIEKVKR